MTRHDDYATGQASYDLRKFRGKGPDHKPVRTCRYHVPPDAARTIVALLALRRPVIAPIRAGSAASASAANPKTWTTVDRGYEDLGIGVQTLFLHAGIVPRPASAGQHCVDQRNAPSWSAVIVLRAICRAGRL